MAKLKAPLMSLGASGAIAKTLVYFPWKGINAVREYVIPTNPQTDRQTDQRAFIKEVVPLLHTQMTDDTDPFDADDKSAYLWLASLSKTPITWFNALCQAWLKAGVAGKIKVFYAHQLAAPASGAVTISAQMVKKTADAFPTTCNVRWGNKKTLLLNSKDCGVITDGAISIELTVVTDGLVAGTQYYFQIRAVEDTAETPSVSGLVLGIPAA
ncbi:hypothetical protein ES708_08555 [subsurface metagenome]